jgi:hypothetical protein
MLPFPIFSIVSIVSMVSRAAAVPWRWLAASAVASVLFIGGCSFGERRITTQWDVEKITAAQAVALQSFHVAKVTEQQTTINQEISDEFNKTKVRLAADRQRLLDRVPVRLRLKPASGDGAVPAVSVSADGVAAATTDLVSAAEPTAASESCQRLAEDAAQTTLMLLEFQRWYAAQSKNDLDKNGQDKSVP